MAKEEHAGQHLTTEVDNVAGDPAARAAGERIEVGTLRLDVYVSRTAALFHVVDQLSEWSYYSHRQYGRAFAPLSDADRAMLAKHKAVRARHSWGQGLEQTFYSPLSLDEALRQGTAQDWLSTEEAATERVVLLHFAARIDTLFNSLAEGLRAFGERLRGELSARARLLQQFARFSERTPDVVPVYVLPNPDPHNSGGGYNGGRLTIEVSPQGDAIPTTLHEVFHAFLAKRKADIASAVARVPGLDDESMNEGLAYAFSPGIVHAGPVDQDPLADQVARDLRAGQLPSDPYTRYHRFGLALRPVLRDALEDDHQTLSTFLPRAIDVWRGLYDAEQGHAGELRTVTVTALHGLHSQSLPDRVKEVTARNVPRPTEILVGVKEWVPGTYRQLSDFFKRASRDFLLIASGHPDLHARLNGHTVSLGDGTFQAYGLEVIPEDRDKIAAGAAYTLKPLNTNDAYRWQVSDGLIPLKLKE
jgi:hypothetical protein